MKRNNAHLVGLALAIVWAIGYTVCAILVAVAPESTAQFFGSMMHIDLSSLTRSIMVGGYITGLVCTTIVAYLYGAAAAWIYSRLAQASPTVEGR